MHSVVSTAYFISIIIDGMQVFTGSKYKDRVYRFYDVIKGAKTCLVVTHNNPDPDAISSAFGVAYLFEQKFGGKATIGYRGIIGRAENKAMVEELGIKLEPYYRLNPEEFDCIVLVDTQYKAHNHPLSVLPDVVIDHHTIIDEENDVPLADYREEYGACATIITEYLLIYGVDITKEVATALLYGIKTDTRDLSRKSTDADVEAYKFLFPLIDRKKLAKIEYPKLPLEYFRSFYHALGETWLYEDVAISTIGTLYRPDLVAEVADYLLRIEGIKWSIAIGFYRGDLYISLRTEASEEADASEVVREVIDTRGSAGGHNVMAGGFIPDVTHDQREALIQAIIQSIIRKLLKNPDSVTPVKLIPARNP